LGKPAIQYCLELLSHTSLRFQYRFANLAAFVLHRTPNQLSTQIRQNIRLCFKDLPKSEQQRIGRESMRHTCYSAIEPAALWFWPLHKVLGQITSFDICAEFEQHTGGKIILVPHLGSWEALAMWLGSTGNAIFLYKRIKNKAIDQFVKQARSRSGGTPVPTKKRGLRQLLIGLKNGDTLMILPDQKPPKNKARIEAEYFGAPAPTTTLVRSLCNKINCEVFLATMCRNSPAAEFSLIIRRLDYQQLAHDEATSAQYMNDNIELLVRQFPEQYQWSYRRFSNRAYAPATGETS
jgi:KDO2-lipid IV(A) lauroyltransferase